MAINRRNFLKTSLAGTALVTLAGAPIVAACSPSAKKPTGEAAKDKAPELKLSFQEGIAPGETLNEKFDYMEKYGIVGFEPWGGGLAGRVNEFQTALKGRNIQIGAICAGFGGFILSTDEAIRREFFTSIKEIIAAAGELGSVGVIMVPAFNSQTPVFPHTQETRDFLCEKLNELGTYAVEHGTTIILEPLNRGEAFYLRMVGDAASICRDVNNPGIRCMGDLWHMTLEETSDYGALFSAGEYLQHIHIASRKRRSMPGEDGDADNYIDAFKALKALHYNRYISYECGCQGDRNIVLPQSIQLLREQWEKA